MRDPKYISASDDLHLLSYLKVPAHAAGLERQAKSGEIESGNYGQPSNTLEFSVNSYWRKEGGSIGSGLPWWPAGKEQGIVGSGYRVDTKNLGVLS